MSLQDMVLNSLMGGANKQPKVTAYQKNPSTGTIGSFDSKSLEKTEKDNLKLDLNNKDWKVSPKEQPEEARKITTFVKEQFDLAYRARQEMELEWIMATAFFEGRQWFRINSETRNLVSIQNDK